MLYRLRYAPRVGSGYEFRRRPIFAAGFRPARERTRLLDGCGGGLRSRDLQVMSLASYRLLYSAPLASCTGFEPVSPP